MAITWVAPKTTDLSTLPENVYWTQPLTVSGNSGPTSFSVISGNLPPGIILNRAAGRLEGVPVVENLTTDIQDFTADTLANVGIDVSIPYRFTIRAQDSVNVTDRSFSLTISNIIPPVIYPRASATRYYNLGAYADGTQLSIQLAALEVSPTATLKWSVTGGRLPPGLTLSESGLLSGVLYPVPSLDDSAGAGWDGSRWQKYPWDFTGLTIVGVFSFEVTVYDGENYDTTAYRLAIYPLSYFSVDSDIFTADEETITADLNGGPGALHSPILLNSNPVLPIGRQLSYYAYKFNAIDFDISGGGGVVDTGELTYTANVSLPLTLDPATGWLYGNLLSQTEEVITYTFSIQVSKTDTPSSNSTPRTFTLPVVADLTQLIEWITPPNLGVIENGSISEFYIQANTVTPTFASSYPTVTSITYTVSDGALPTGLELQSNGLITGRFTFQYFTLDSNTTTIDSGATSFDLTYSFTANAIGYDINGSMVSSSERTFTMLADILNPTSYDDIYIRAHPSLDQRNQFANIINAIFSESDAANFVYRANDPYFGVATSIKSLFLPGLTPSETYAYAEAMQTNHYAKRFLFGDIKTAIALDSNFEPKYEVVYVELLDDMINAAGQSPNPIQDLTNKISVGYLVGDEEYKIAYPATYDIMKQLIAARTGYAKKGALPGWMTSRQPDGTILGFTQALVLCYLQPSSGKRNAEIIARRFRSYLSNQGISFNAIEFVADRYILDKNLESYPDMADKYLKFPRLGVFI